MSTTLLTRSSDLFPVLFDDYFTPWNDWFSSTAKRTRALTTPAANVRETQNDYRISIAAPGLKKNDFKINVEGNMLTISSEKEESNEEKDAEYTRKEYSFTSFSRSFTLPDEVNQDKIEAGYEDGVLTVMIPKKEESKKYAVSRQIAIK